MSSLRRAVRESVEQLQPGTRDKLFVWAATAVGLVGSTAAWLLV